MAKRTGHRSTQRARTRIRDKQHKDEQTRAKSWAREWLDAILFALVAVIIIRAFFFEAYRIPSPSMEQTLLTGDFLMVSRMHYGARTPMTIGLPFTNIYLRGVELPSFRMPGFMDVNRDDIVVFNYPVDQTITSRKTNYIKRAVGIPGDTLRVEDKRFIRNGKPEEIRPTYEHNYRVEVSDGRRLSSNRIREAGGRIARREGSDYIIRMSERVTEEVSAWNEVDQVELEIWPESFNHFGQVRFPFARAMEGNYHNMGPVILPETGMEIELNSDNWHMYREAITRFEGNELEQNGGQILINGEPANSYTFEQNYYFMVGDSRDNSEDSRVWGFVPEDHIVGRAVFIYFSWDSDRLLPRFSRIFSIIH